MEDTIIPLIRQRIAQLYSDCRTLLLEQKSYHTPVDTQNVRLYFTFLEAALKQPFNRLASLREFIMDEDGLLVGFMMPFRELRETVQATIDAKFGQAQKLALALDCGGLDPDYRSLTDEEVIWGAPE